MALRDVLYSDWRFGHYSDWLTLPRSSGFFIKYLDIFTAASRMTSTPHSGTENQGDQAHLSHNFCCMPHANQILSASRPDNINEQTVPSRRLQRTRHTILSASRPDNMNEHTVPSRRPQRTRRTTGNTRIYLEKERGTLPCAREHCAGKRGGGQESHGPSLTQNIFAYHQLNTPPRDIVSTDSKQQRRGASNYLIATACGYIYAKCHTHSRTPNQGRGGKGEEGEHRG